MISGPCLGMCLGSNSEPSIGSQIKCNFGATGLTIPLLMVGKIARLAILRFEVCGASSDSSELIRVQVWFDAATTWDEGPKIAGKRAWCLQPGFRFCGKSPTNATHNN